MATPNKKVEKDPEVAIEQALGRSEQFIERNGKKLLIALFVIVIIVGGYFAYTNWYLGSRSDEAASAMFRAQNSFEVDSFAMAVNGLAGPEGFIGFEEIATEYSSTNEGKLARHYAGICYLNMGDFKNALASFELFDGLKGGVGEVISAQNTGLMGDCYTEMGEVARGAELYEKAANESKTLAIAPTYLHKAAIANYTLGKFDKALVLFKLIQSDYPQSINARDIDKYIALVQQKL